MWKFYFIIPSQNDRFKSGKYRSYRDKEKHFEQMRKRQKTVCCNTNWRDTAATD